MAFEIDFLVTYDKESIAAELRRISKATGKRTLTKEDINEHGRLCAKTVMDKFGTLRNAHKAAKLVPGVFMRATDQELLKMVVDLWTITNKKFGRSPLTEECRKYGLPVSAQTISARFGSWHRALMAASKMVTHPPKPEKKGSAKTTEMAAAKKKRLPISVRRRFLVFQRDGYTCQMCKRRGGELQLDHVIPVSRNGSDNLENLQTLCRDCNLGKKGSLE